MRQVLARQLSLVAPRCRLRNLHSRPSVEACTKACAKVECNRAKRPWYCRLGLSRNRARQFGFSNRNWVNLGASTGDWGLKGE